eukprot:CAMPEP_0198731292 /NCGR_PEP_ID=MMETSP1475-20131203/29213_1 /TAXON_ID= ORGANISM="Unidentified sp., Strain CCMP1999" /NCGR_SAMPLE_ID=MMETSP1475 /ASSEMBLY_ACC=CAM_ASM_001111 /LENGTH=186 /DNA_ID=CAMNT_0044494245 /DNA_START=23 /DNA_END=583 /DNA_ORIENTATION=+
MILTLDKPCVEFSKNTTKGTVLRVPSKNPGQITYICMRRSTLCCVCRRFAADLVRRNEDLKANNIKPVVVVRTDEESVAELERDMPDTALEFISDAEGDLYNLFEVQSSLIKSFIKPSSAKKIIKTMMLTPDSRVPKPFKGMCSLPAEFLIDENGAVIAAKYSSGIADHWHVDEVLEIVSKHRASM